jgi:enoyl-CoA hydratase/carnithine racemase
MTSENGQGVPILPRDDRGAVALLRLNRPSKLNALSNELLAAIMHTLDQIELYA